MIGRVRQVVVFIFEITLCHGLTKNNTLSLSLSTVEVEYIAAGCCHTQLIWLNKMLTDYGFPQPTLTLFCDSTSAINISKNLVQHSRTKHIDIRHQFIRQLDFDSCQFISSAR